MKPYLLKAVIALMVFLSPNILTAQPTITNHQFTDSCHQVSFVVNTQNVANLTVTTFYGDGNSKNSIVYSGFYKTVHQYLLPGTYSVKHVLKHNGNPVDSVSFSFSNSLCSHAMVQIYGDYNSNCTKDASELTYSGSYWVEIDSLGYKIDTINVNNYYYKKLKQGATYTFKLLNTPLGASSVCSGNTRTVTVPISQNFTYVDFGIQCSSTSSHDLNILKIAGFYRPVDKSYLYVWPANNSCFDQNGTLAVSFSPKYNYHTAYPQPTSVSGNTVTWNLPVGLTHLPYVSIVLTPVGTITLGDTICASASISPTTGDVNPANNNLTQCDTVVSSFDPNSKEVTPAGNIMPGTKLDYTINFENLGNDTAFNIHILDTLSQYVDANSFQMTSSSHRASSSLLPGPNGKKILKFEFVDIKLADSSHPESNKGFVTYSINAKTGLALGTEIENRAGIYFDINPVVMTNTAINKIDWNVGIDEVYGNKPLQVYPNPTSDVFTVKAPKTFTDIKVMNSLGQVVATQAHTSEETTIDLAKMPAGMYYILVSGTNGSVAEKVEKR